MPRTFLVRRDEHVESETDCVELTACETDIPSAADVDDRKPSLSCVISDVNQFRMLSADRTRNPLQSSTLTERSESKYFVNLDTGNIEQQTSPLDMLANAALERSVPLATRNASSNDTNAMSENVNCGPLAENSRRNVTELTKSPRKQRAVGKENSPRKSLKRNQSLPSFASLAYNMVLSNQPSNPNPQNDSVCATSNGAKHTMPPVPIRSAFPLARRKLPINSPSFKVWNELKPSSVIHPSSPFLRSCQPEEVRSIQPEVKAKKKLLPETNLDTKKQIASKSSEEPPVVIQKENEANICDDERGVVISKQKKIPELENNLETDNLVSSVNIESANTEKSTETEVVKECFPLECPSVVGNTNSVVNSALNSSPLQSHDIIVSETLVNNTVQKDTSYKKDETTVLKTISVHNENTKTLNSAKPKIWNPMFHEPSSTSASRFPVEIASTNKSEIDVSETTPHILRASWHQPSTVYRCLASTQSVSHVSEGCSKNEKSTHALSNAAPSASKSSFHKFSIDSILSRVEKNQETSSNNNLNDEKSFPVSNSSLNDNERAPEPEMEQAPKRIRLHENQSLPRQSVIVATSSAIPSLIRTSTPVLNTTEAKTPTIDEKENISASVTPVFLWNSKAASEKPGPIVYKHPALIAMASTNSSPFPKSAANILLPIVSQPSPIRSLKPTIGELRNWNIPVPSQQMPSPVIVKQEPELHSPIQVSPAIQLRPQVSPAAQIAPQLANSVQMTSQVSPAIQVAPQASPTVQMAPYILPAPPTSNTHMTFQKQQSKMGGVKVYDENHSGKLPLPLSADVELVNGGFGLKNPSFRPPKPTDITNVCKDPVSGNGKYACSVCKKEFALQRLLNRHLKCHSDTKRFLCTFCGKGFNDTFDLKRHTRIHTGVKPYKCSKCERSFTQRCSLESHCRKVHNIEFTYAYKQRRSKIYVCEECGHSTDDPEVHYVHLRDNHPNNPALTKCHDKRQFKFNENNRQTLSLPRT